MGVTGAIFGVIAVAWLVYLVPQFLHRRAHPGLDDLDPAEPFTASVTIVRKGTSLASAEDGAAVLSTPLTRRAALYELSQIEGQAAVRRRNVLFFLLGVLVVVSALAGFQLVAWWGPMIAAATLVAFLVVARISVKAMRADLARRAARITDAHDEQTVPIAVIDEDADDTGSIELSAPLAASPSLWDPIPITAPTYVSKPLAPRTVRTIDLSAPLPAARAELPVIADAPETDLPDEHRRAAGE